MPCMCRQAAVVWLHSFLSLSLGGVGGQRQVPAAVPSEKRRGIHCGRGSIGPRACLREHVLSRPELETLTVQPVAIRYTNCAIPARNEKGTDGRKKKRSHKTYFLPPAIYSSICYYYSYGCVFIEKSSLSAYVLFL